MKPLKKNTMFLGFRPISFFYKCNVLFFLGFVCVCVCVCVFLLNSERTKCPHIDSKM